MRALFGMTCSTFLLINQDLDTWEQQHPASIKEVRDIVYVDDLVTREETVKAAASKNIIATEVFSNATFEIQLKGSPNSQSSQQDLTFPKQQVRRGKPSQGTFLGLPWDRDADTSSVMLKTTQKKTKRGVLSQLASVYDTLGLA